MFGASYHPQSQGYIEGRHQIVNRTLAAYSARYPTTWAKHVKLAQWAMRATPRADRADRSPFELVTGLRPQGPCDVLFRKLGEANIQGPGDYVRDLQAHLEGIHQLVGIQLAGEHESKLRRSEQQANTPIQAGEFVFIKRPPAQLQPDGATGSTSRRLLPRAGTRVFRVRRVVSPQNVILEDPDTEETDIGIAQPVHIERLVKYDLCALQQPLDSERPLRIEIRRDNEWYTATLIAQSATGAVTLRFSDGAETQVHLQSEEYRWLH